MLYVFEKLEKLNFYFKTQIWNALNLDIHGGKFWPLHSLWRNWHKFLDILELEVENKKKYFRENSLENVVSDLWKNGICV